MKIGFIAWASWARPWPCTSSTLDHSALVRALELMANHEVAGA
jgi:hypothetical protein